MHFKHPQTEISIFVLLNICFKTNVPPGRATPSALHWPAAKPRIQEKECWTKNAGYFDPKYVAAASYYAVHLLWALYTKKGGNSLTTTLTKCVLRLSRCFQR